jgi:soluble epoxide hydrolase/lipid-phosphate phosphatase
MPIPTPNRSHKVPSSGHTYHYIYHSASSPQKPTLLFIHGFPSTSDQWRHQIAHFRPQGYGILVPDLLGYGNTSKPTSPSSYKGSIMSADIISIMDHENISGKVIGISHDWGTYLMSQLAIYYPERFDKYVFMSAPHSPPGRAMDVHTLNRVTKKKNGYEQFGYWLFFTADRAGKTIGKHVSLKRELAR